MPAQPDWRSVAEQSPVIECSACHRSTASFDCVSRRGIRRSPSGRLLVHTPTEHVCYSCATRSHYQCVVCGYFFSLETAETRPALNNGSGGRACPRCALDSFICDNCEGIYNNDCRDLDADDCLCHACARDAQRDDDEEVLRYRHSRRHGRLHPRKLYYGVELEVETSSSVIDNKWRAARDLFGGTADIKSDGSLDCGFEIATVPASLEGQYKLWTKFFDNRKVIDGLRSFRTNTCGLHVHVSRKPLSELTIAKIVCFVNAAHNRRFMAIIAGRPSSEYARYIVKKFTTNWNPYDKRLCNPNRYEAVNLQNAHTIEFRCFKGTLKKESLFKAVEFADSIVHYAQTRSLTDSQSRVGYLTYLESSKKQWPHLQAFVDAKWLGRETKLTKLMKYAPYDRSREAEVQTSEEI